MRKRSNSDRFDYIASQKGMFSRLPLNTAQLEQLRSEYGIYIVGALLIFDMSPVIL